MAASLGESSSWLDSSTVIDVLTVVVLGFDIMVLYNSLGFGAEITKPFSSVKVTAIQATAGIMAIYLIESIIDWKKD
ncbi:MAG: hypothetical protein ABEJ72_09090 [Candidatus Aenigmatarchaeota archaeon]